MGRRLYISHTLSRHPTGREKARNEETAALMKHSKWLPLYDKEKIVALGAFV